MFGLWVEILTQAQGKHPNSTLMCFRFESWNMLLWSNTFIPCTSKTHPNQTYSIIWFSARGHLTAEVLAGCLCVNAIPQSSQDVPTHLPRDQTMLAERDWTSTVCFEGLLEKVSSLLKEHDSLTLKTSIWANQMASLSTVGPNTQHVAIAHQHLIHLASCHRTLSWLIDHKLLCIPKYSRGHLSDHSSKSLT